MFLQWGILIVDYLKVKMLYTWTFCLCLRSSVLPDLLLLWL